MGLNRAVSVVVKVAAVDAVGAVVVVVSELNPAVSVVLKDVVSVDTVGLVTTGVVVVEVVLSVSVPFPVTFAGVGVGMVAVVMD